jgi:hypothetical protein
VNRALQGQWHSLLLLVNGKSTSINISWFAGLRKQFGEDLLGAPCTKFVQIVNKVCSENLTPCKECSSSDGILYTQHALRLAVCRVQLLSCCPATPTSHTISQSHITVEFTTFGCFFVQIFQCVSSYHSQVRFLCNFMKKSTLRLRWTVLLSCNVLKPSLLHVGTIPSVPSLSRSQAARDWNHTTTSDFCLCSDCRPCGAIRCLQSNCCLQGYEQP